MGRSSLVLVAGVLLLGTACAYQRAMHKGEHLASAGDWEGAYTAYSTAVDHKPADPEAAKGKDQARDHLVDTALETAKSAVASLQFETAVDQIARVEALDPDRPEVFQLKGDAERAMAGEIARLWDSGDARGTYAMAVRARKLFPKASYLEPEFNQLRAHFSTRAEALLKERKFDYALVAIRTIPEFEPDRAAATAPIEHRILSAWADDCASRGEQYAKAHKIGAAAALLARAYEIAGRPDDLKRAQALAQTLVPSGTFAVQLSVTGAPDRATALRDAVAGSVAKIPDAVVVPAAGVLAAKLIVSPQRCAEVDHPSKGTKDYVSGQIAKPNPAHAELAAQLAKAKADLQTSTVQAAKLQPDLAAAEAAVKGFDAKLAELEKKHAEAQSQADLADQQLAASKAHRDDLEAQYEAAKAAGTSTAALEPQLAQSDAAVAEWGKAAATRREVEDVTRAKLASLTMERAPAVDARDRLQAGYTSLTTDRTNAQAMAQDLATRLATTPTTVMEDVHQTFTYDIHDWTRTCTAPVSATLAPRWKTALPTARTFAPANQITDRAHVGFAKAAVDLDPKAYPSSDAELVARGDADTAAAVAVWLGALADDWFRTRVGETGAALQPSPVDATSSVVALYLAAHDRLDADTVTAFQAHVNAQFGLQKLDLLVSTPTP